GVDPHGGVGPVLQAAHALCRVVSGGSDGARPRHGATDLGQRRRGPPLAAPAAGDRTLPGRGGSEPSAGRRRTTLVASRAVRGALVDDALLAPLRAPVGIARRAVVGQRLARARRDVLDRVGELLAVDVVLAA